MREKEEDLDLALNYGGDCAVCQLPWWHLRFCNAICGGLDCWLGHEGLNLKLQN